MATLADLLASRALGLNALHLADPEVALRWVAVSELADPAPFLEGGELLLTTGLETTGWRREWSGYVERLAAASTAGIGLGTGLTHRRAPAALISACRRHGVNLVEVPRSTTFVSVSREVARLVADAEEVAAREVLAMQRRLTQAALQTDDVGSLLTRLSQLVAGNACLLAADGAIQRGQKPAGLAADRIRDEVRRLQPGGMRAALGFGETGTTASLHPVGLGERPDGYLLVTSAQRLNQAARAAVTTTVALLSLSAQRGREQRRTDRALRDRALDVILDGDLTTGELLLAATTTATKVPGPRLRVVAAPGEPAELEAALERFEAAGALARVADNELVALISKPATAFDALDGLPVQAGIGAPCRPDTIDQGLATARQAAALAVPTRPVVTWDDLVESGPLSLVEPERAADFARSFLAPIDSPDGVLVDTLRSFLTHHGSLASVATELAIHRNTVRNRLQQIEERLGRSLDDPQERASAWFALQADVRT